MDCKPPLEKPVPRDGLFTAAKSPVLPTVSLRAKAELLFEGHLTGHVHTVCYDVVNNIDQGTGYTVGSFLSGAVGDEQDECTGSCAVGNTGSSGGSSGSSGPPPPPPGGPKVRRQGAGALGGAANLENESNDVLTQVGATLGTLESSPTSTLGGDLGNEVYDLTSGAQDKLHNADGAAPAAPGLKIRQLNKVVTGIHDAGGAFGLGAVVAPVDTVVDDIDTVGTSGVGDLGNQVGNVLDQTLSSS